MNAPELITADELARHFGVTAPTVNRWVRRGLIPCIRASRKVVRFVLADVETALSSQCAKQAATVAVELGEPEGERREKETESTSA